MGNHRLSRSASISRQISAGDFGRRTNIVLASRSPPDYFDLK
jgi:hypothetical protein